MASRQNFFVAGGVISLLVATLINLLGLRALIRFVVLTVSLQSLEGAADTENLLFLHAIGFVVFYSIAMACFTRASMKQ